MATLTIELQNQSQSSRAYAFITGLAIDSNNARFILSADAKTPYFPASPGQAGTPLARDCAIPLGPPGQTVKATIPHIAGGRIWFSFDEKLKFLLNPGPGLVEPAVTNPSDPNINIDWGFCEFTWNSAQLFANITYVDFVSVPIGLVLTDKNGGRQIVQGLPSNGLDLVCAGLNAQQNIDQAGWSKLIVKSPSGGNLRALSPNNGIVLDKGLFRNYFADYIAKAWNTFKGQKLRIDTQADWAIVAGEQNKSGSIDFGTDGKTQLTFAPPSTQDIFSCSTGPFAPSPSIKMGALIARLAAACNRSVIATGLQTPDTSQVSQYYRNPVTNHYARIVHLANPDGRGYAFPFDDVQPTAGKDQSGAVQAGNPQTFTVILGGGNVSAPKLVVQ